MKNVLILLCVMVVASIFLAPIVYAESAWVLWVKKEYVKTNMQQDVFWEIVNAYPEYKQCQQAKNRVWQVTKKQAMEDKQKYSTISEIKEVPGELVITNFKEPNDIMSKSETFYCLPGTLDPRERK